MTKVEQWVEIYRSRTYGEIKATLETFYKIKYWHDLHVALWTWLSLDGEREKKEWFEMFDVPRVTNYCFACEAAPKCVNCPLPRITVNEGECANGPSAKWVSTHKIAEREELAREVAEQEWNGQK